MLMMRWPPLEGKSRIFLINRGFNETASLFIIQMKFFSELCVFAHFQVVWSILSYHKTFLHKTLSKRLQTMFRCDSKYWFIVDGFCFEFPEKSHFFVRMFLSDTVSGMLCLSKLLKNISDIWEALREAIAMYCIEFGDTFLWKFGEFIVEL